MDRKIIFHHKRAVGDGIMFTAGVRDFKLLFPEIQVNVESNYPELWENNPYLDRSIKRKDPGVEYYRIGYPSLQTSNNGYLHFSTGFLLDMIAIADGHKSLPISLGEFCAAFANGEVGDPEMGKPDKNPELAREPFISWEGKYKNYFKVGDRKKGLSEKFARQRGDLHLSDEEKAHNIIAEEYGIEKYWLVAPGGKTDCTCKLWDWRRFQKVIDHFDGLIKFVTVGRNDREEFILDKFDNVISMTDKTSLRQLFQLAYHAQGAVTGVSLLVHVMGAFNQPDSRARKPCVQIVGGREPTTYTWYCNHQILHTNGALDCCDNGGCWQSRVVPIAKASKGENKRLCHNPVVSDGRTIPKCMDMITAEDVIKAIERYFQDTEKGGLYQYLKPMPAMVDTPLLREKPKSCNTPIYRSKSCNKKEINFLASLQSKGGGEQSAIRIVELLRADGWKVNLYPWEKVHSKFKEMEHQEETYKDGMLANMANGLPLFFYANDQIWDFVKTGREIIEKSSSVIVGINWANGSLPKATWMREKLKAVIFQNREKMGEWDRDVLGFDKTERICLFGAIDLEEYLKIPIRKREGDEPLVILKHGVNDFRKYVTTESQNNGQKIHVWQKHFWKETDIRFYERLLKDCKFKLKFRFMEAPSELVKHFAGDDRFDFLKFDEIPVPEFLASGHVYLHRCSNLWRDNYPRTVAEAMAAGLPVLGEPRDGTLDRIQPADSGFHCPDYDAYLYGMKVFHRKEDYRQACGVFAKKWAKENLNPIRWVEEINRVLL